MAAPPPNLIAALEATVHRVLERLGRDLDGLRLTPGEINALFHLDPAAGTTVAALLEATGQRPSTLSGVLNRLEEQGLLARTINPRDRRSFLLTLTGDGDAAAIEVHRAFAALEAEVLDRVPPRAPSAFRGVLDAVDDACRPRSVSRGQGQRRRSGLSRPPAG
jgi:DNA-binding MarR family transcriptional regulator